MIQILVYGMTDNLGGMETFMLSYMQRIPKEKIRFDFISPFDRIAIEDEIKERGGRVIHLPNRKRHFFKYHKKFNSFMRDNSKKYDAVWLNDCMFCNLDILKYAKKYNIKTRIIHAHNSQPMGSKSQLIRHELNKPFLTKYATHFWACSSLAAEWSYPKKVVQEKTYTVIPNAIDCEKYRYNSIIRNRIRNELGYEKNVVVGNIGRLHFQKNQAFLLDVFYEFQKHEPNAVLLLIGAGEDEDLLKAKCKKLHLENKVRFMGIRHDVPELLQGMDIFVMPSKFEGLGIAAIESQAAGLPTLLSDVIPKETQVTDYAVYLSLSDSVRTWANMIQTMLNNMTRCDVAIEMKKSKFDIVTAAINLVKIMEEIAA